MRVHDALSAVFILILVYLLLKSATNTNKVVQGLGSGLSNVISTLQGNAGNQLSAT